jgi:hypothetical protein
MRLATVQLIAIVTAGLLGCDDAEFDDDTVGDDDVGDDDDAGGDDDAASDDDIGDDDDTAGTETLFDLSVTWSHDAGEDSACPTVNAGRFVDTDGDGIISDGEPMQTWLGAWNRQQLIAHDGTVLGGYLDSTDGANAIVGEVDPNSEGMEALVRYDEGGGTHHWIALYGAAGELWSAEVPMSIADVPWLTDLEGDGDREVVLGALILDASTGAQLASLEGMAAEDTGTAVTADLDLDGVEEIIAASENEIPTRIGLFDETGAALAECLSIQDKWIFTSFAVGNLDDDPEGEFVAVGTGFAAVCDSDGTLLEQVVAPIVNPGLVGLAELDGDEYPEIVLSDANGVFALEHDLTFKWEDAIVPLTGIGGHHPLTLADLDGDCLHEILVRIGDQLFILDSYGAVIASLVGSSNSSCFVSAPAVVDVDGDGLAEILVPDWPTLALVENPQGGWQVEGASEARPYRDKHPGDRSALGELPPPHDVHWARPGHNVWQGLPTIACP